MPVIGRTPERVDLSETAAFFLALKRDQEWRDRLVADLQFGRRNYVRLSSAYQINFPPGLLEPFVDLRRTRRANLLLPLTTREKRPLLNFSVSGPAGGPATVTSRPSIAGLQKLNLTALVDEGSAWRELAPLIDEDLWESICLFSPTLFEDVFLKRRKEKLVPALVDYLSSGLHFQVSEDDVLRWRTRTKEAAGRLVEWLGEPPDPFSSSEEVLLAIPEMERLPASIPEVDEVVDRYVEAVLIAHNHREAALLEALAEYGRRYELIIEVELPLLEPSRVRVEEDLPFRLPPLAMQSWVEQTIALGDARSAHLEARIEDPAVEFRRDPPRVRELAGHDGSGWLEAVRVSREAVALYTSAPERPRYLKIAVRLGVVRYLMATCLILILINLAGIFFALSLSSGDLAGALAVVVVPTTVAATFALVREQTALANRLQAASRGALAASTVALWGVASVLLVSRGDPMAGHQERPLNAPQSQVPTSSQRYDGHTHGGSHGEKRSKRQGKSRGS
jgi:hypothetical protein